MTDSDTDNGGRPNILIKAIVNVLFLQSMYNKADELAETFIRDRISFTDITKLSWKQAWSILEKAAERGDQEEEFFINN